MSDMTETMLDVDGADAMEGVKEGGKKGGVPKWVFVAGCSALAALCGLVVLVAGVFIALQYFGGADPAAAIAPRDTALYMSVDLLKLQSDDTARLVDVFQEVAGVEDPRSLREAMTELFADADVDLTFEEDIEPWVGRYAAVVVSGVDLDAGEADYMVVLQTRNNGDADAFLEKLAGELEDVGAYEFDVRERNGITLYVYESEFTFEEDFVMARAGKFVYFANSEDLVLESAGLRKSDSLAGTDAYRAVVRELDRNRLFTLFVPGDFMSEFLELSMDEVGVYGGTATDLEDLGLLGMGMSASAQSEGLRLDLSMSYDEDKLTDDQKRLYFQRHSAPTTAELLPADTFLFAGVRGTEPIGGSYLNNPNLPEETLEAIELLEIQLGVSIQDLADVLGNEYAFAMGPASDGLFPDAMETNLGFVVLGTTPDEQGFVDWMAELMEVAAAEMFVPVETSEIDIAGYGLHQVTVVDSFLTVDFLVYGADNGYFLLSTSRGMLEAGLPDGDSLADDDTYRATWRAFSSSSAPYFYLNLDGLADFILTVPGMRSDPDFATVEVGMRKMPVVAGVLNQASGTTQSLTFILFVEEE